ncbi:MAG: KpsF/GutQ family sugar-phosphate isomerase [Candidatus Omnitrophota bacterium]
MSVAKETLKSEADAILQVSSRLGDNIDAAVKIILNYPGKTVVAGMGKSGHIAQKIAATLCSTGTPSVFLHPAEALHGDLGVYEAGDPTILISKSGSTNELLRLIPLLRSLKSPLIAIIGNLDSPLAREADVILDACVEREADPLGLAPTASAITALALGDALASALMSARRFTEQDFANFHPAGQLGRNLWLKVADVMHPKNRVAQASPDSALKELIISMTQYNLGAACVLDENERLAGIITDGDLRRALLNHEETWTLRAADMMTRSPVTISPHAALKEALQLMEDRPSQISVLPVLETSTNRWLGLIRVHDIYQPMLV